MSNFHRAEANHDFNRAVTRALFERFFGVLGRENQELLSFEEVKHLLQPKSQAYKGMRTVPIHHIVGSEGRYQDFTKRFLPRREHLRNRWTSVDEARLKDVVLPPIQLYELGGVYFVRDGNHRVSVAKSQGVEAIDAEIISLETEIKLDPDLSISELRALLLDYEYKKFCETTGILELFPEANLRVSSPGQIGEILYHIYTHKYFMNQGQKEEIPLSTALRSWYDSVYFPIVNVLNNEDILGRFPDRTEADLYVWIVKHWHFLKERFGPAISPTQAARSFSKLYGLNFAQRLFKRIRNALTRVR